MDTPTNTSMTSNAFNRGVDSASESMHKAIDSASDAAGPAIKYMADGAHNTVNKVTVGAHSAAEAISTKGSQLHHLQQKLTESTRAQVRSQPLLTIAAVLAGGMLLSWWLSRSNNHRDAS